MRAGFAANTEADNGGFCRYRRAETELPRRNDEIKRCPLVAVSVLRLLPLKTARCPCNAMRRVEKAMGKEQKKKKKKQQKQQKQQQRRQRQQQIRMKSFCCFVETVTQQANWLVLACSCAAERQRKAGPRVPSPPDPRISSTNQPSIHPQHRGRLSLCFIYECAPRASCNVCMYVCMYVCMFVCMYVVVWVVVPRSSNPPPASCASYAAQERQSSGSQQPSHVSQQRSQPCPTLFPTTYIQGRSLLLPAHTPARTHSHSRRRDSRFTLTESPRLNCCCGCCSCCCCGCCSCSCSCCHYCCCINIKTEVDDIR